MTGLLSALMRGLDGSLTFGSWHSRAFVSGLNNFLAIQFFARATDVAYTFVNS